MTTKRNVVLHVLPHCYDYIVGHFAGRVVPKKLHGPGQYIELIDSPYHSPALCAQIIGFVEGTYKDNRTRKVAQVVTELITDSQARAKEFDRLIFPPTNEIFAIEDRQEIARLAYEAGVKDAAAMLVEAYK